MSQTAVPSGDDRASREPPPPAAASGLQAVEGWATLDTGDSVQLASLFARFYARFLDFFCISGLAGLVMILTAVLGRTSPGVLALEGVVVAVVAVFFEVALTATKGQTWGKETVGIKVIRSDNGLVPGWGRSLGRYLASWGTIPGLGYVLALVVCAPLLWDRTHQGLHDKAAATLVVDAPPPEGRGKYAEAFAPENGYANSAAVFGLGSIFFPAVGPVFGIIGLVLSKKALNRLPPKGGSRVGEVKRRASAAKWGLITSIVGTTLQTTVWVLVLADGVF